MTRLAWNAPGKREFQTGVDRGVLYASGKPGVPWNGLVKVTETPTGGIVKPRYYDGVKIANPATAEEFAGTLEAFSSPIEFDACDGTISNGHGLSVAHQPRKQFNLSYRTGLGNDLEGLSFGYKLHLLYNLMAAPSTVENATQGQMVDPANLTWALTAKPAYISGYRPSSHLILDSTQMSGQVMAYIEGILYGSATASPRMPSYTELDKITTLMVFRQVIKNKSGWNPLVDSETPDVSGYLDSGKYSITPNSRIVPAGKPGFYVLES